MKILKGLAFLHTKKHQIHRDIKPANMIVIDDKLKLIDFGRSRYISDCSIEKNSNITIITGQFLFLLRPLHKNLSQ